MSVQRQKYNSGFKRNMPQLSMEAGRTVREVADNLGIACPDIASVQAVSGSKFFCIK